MCRTTDCNHHHHHQPLDVSCFRYTLAFNARQKVENKKQIAKKASKEYNHKIKGIEQREKELKYDASENGLNFSCVTVKGFSIYFRPHPYSSTLFRSQKKHVSLVRVRFMILYCYNKQDYNHFVPQPHTHPLTHILCLYVYV